MIIYVYTYIYIYIYIIYYSVHGLYIFTHKPEPTNPLFSIKSYNEVKNISMI